MANKANSLAHTKWMCKYHIVFTPKYRRKIIYNQYKASEADLNMIRKAKKKDLSRIAEILVFVKRIKYRPIFQNDDYSFGDLQVIKIAEEYSNPEKLDNIWVYDDGIVKGMIGYENVIEVYSRIKDSQMQQVALAQLRVLAEF